MKTHHVMVVSMLLAFSIRTGAQDIAAPSSAGAKSPPPAQTEMQKWLADTDAQWQTAFKRDIADVHNAELGKARLQYLQSLETAVAKASAAGDLDAALALRNEEKRFRDTSFFPKEDEATDTASVKQIRVASRVQFVRLEKDNAARVEALLAKYDKLLAQAQTQLTQRGRLDDALLVKNKRAEITTAWITLANKASSENPEAVTAATEIQKPAASQTDIASPSGLTIISAIFGIDNRTVDTTKRLQAVYASGEPSLLLNCRESAGGNDPAPSVGKETTITYAIHGKRKTKTFREGHVLVFKEDLQ